CLRQPFGLFARHPARHRVLDPHALTVGGVRPLRTGNRLLTLLLPDGAHIATPRQANRRSPWEFPHSASRRVADAAEKLHTHYASPPSSRVIFTARRRCDSAPLSLGSSAGSKRPSLSISPTSVTTSEPIHESTTKRSVTVFRTNSLTTRLANREWPMD